MTNKDLHPICYYVNDREEMINQMFSTMKEDKVRSMLPPLLKGFPMDELKSSCLEELLGLSSKRIKSIVAGQELQSSSDSEDNELSGSDVLELSDVESNSDSGEEPRSVSKRLSRDTRLEDTLQIAITSEEMGDLLEEPTSRTTKPKKQAISTSKGEKTSKASLATVSKATNGLEARRTNEAVVPTEGKTLLEIVELELRARAIRAALLHQEKILENREPADTGLVIEIKEEIDKPTNPIVSAIYKPSSSSEKQANSAHQSMVDNVQDNTKQASTKKNTELPQEDRKVFPKIVDDDIEIICEEISSDEAILDEIEEAEEPIVIEPIIESIVISSESEAEEPVEKQLSWKERWMQKKDVASVMKTSKLITSVKRKMKLNKSGKLASAAQALSDQREKTSSDATAIQGTVSEFNLLTSVASSSVSKQDSTGSQTLTRTGLEHCPTEHIATEHSQVETSLSHLSRKDTSESELPLLQEPILVDSSPSEQTTMDNSKCEQTAVENSQCERTTTENSPQILTIEYSPCDKTLIEKSPLEKPTVENSPLEKPTVENSLCDQTTVENCSLEQTMIEKSPGNQTSIENFPCEEPTIENSLCEQPTIENPLLEQSLPQVSVVDALVPEDLHQISSTSEAQQETPEQLLLEDKTTISSKKQKVKKQRERPPKRLKSVIQTASSRRGQR